MPKRILNWAGIAFVVLILVLISGYIIFSDKTDCTITNHQTGNCIDLERVSGQDALTGLAKYDFYSDQQGMVFVFDPPGRACMWMKDMKFAIDMVWLNEQQEIIQIKTNVSPDSYPESFCAPSPAKYVVELNEFVAQKAELKVGQQLSL